MKKVIIIALAFVTCLHAQFSIGSFTTERFDDLRVSMYGPNLTDTLHVRIGRIGTSNNSWPYPDWLGGGITRLIRIESRPFSNIIEGNPTVLEFINPLTAGFVDGYMVHLYGVAGAGCAVLNANLPLTVVGANSFSVPVDTTALACSGGNLGSSVPVNPSVYIWAESGTIGVQMDVTGASIISCNGGLGCFYTQSVAPGFPDSSMAPLAIAGFVTVGESGVFSNVIDQRSILGSTALPTYSVTGPAAHADSLFSQWNGVNTRVLKAGIAGVSTNTPSTLVMRDINGDFSTRNIDLTLIRAGNGSFGGTWPYNIAVDSPIHIKNARGTRAAPVVSTFPAGSFTSYASGVLPGNVADWTFYSERSGGDTRTVSIAAVPQTAGDGGGALAAHVMMEKGTIADHNSGFPLWLSCQLFNIYDNCSNEINPVNESVADAPNEGEYISGGLVNGLAIIAAGAKKASSAFYIGTQDLVNAQFQRGIDFQQNSIALYPIVLPNGKGIFSRNAANNAKIPLIWSDPSNNTVVNTYTGTYLYLTVNGVAEAYIDNVGDFNFLDGRMRSTGKTYAQLGAPASFPGSVIWCTDCTIASPCGAGGSGAWAFVVTGPSWKCPF